MDQLWKYYSQAERWLSQATKSLYYPPDRRRVRQELKDHLEEKSLRYQNAGMSESEAIRKALADMGDPDETAQLLRAVHKPWLGWACRIAKNTMILLLVFFSWMSFRGDISPESLGFQSQEQLFDDDTKLTLIADRDAEWTQNTLRFGPFDYGIDSVWCRLCREKTRDQETNAEDGFWNYNENCLLLRFTAAPWHILRRSVLEDKLYLLNQNGEEIAFYIDEVQRVRPWETLVAIDFYPQPGDLASTQISVYMNQEGTTRSLQIKLGDWRLASDALSSVADSAKDLQLLTEMPCASADDPDRPELYSSIARSELTGARSASCSNRVELTHETVSIPWARQGSYRVDVYYYVPHIYTAADSSENIMVANSDTPEDGNPQTMAVLRCPADAFRCRCESVQTGGSSL